MEKIIAYANSSVSTLYGCIGYSVQDYIMNKFPKDFFKFTTVSSELASRNIRRNFRTQNTNNEMAKRQKPCIIIQPTYSVMESDGALQGIPLTTNFDDLQYRTDARYLFDVLKDYENGYCLKFKMNRDRIEFDVQLLFDTLHQQLDTYKAIQNQMRWERSFAHRIALESVIPKKLIAYMSKMAHMDLEEHSEYIPIFLRKLNSVSGYPITYKLRNASATDEWFMYYLHDIILTFTDLAIDQGQRKNMTEDSFGITFRVTAEFNMPAIYFVDALPDKIVGLDLSIKTKEYDSDNETIVPVFSIENLFSRYPNEKDGKQLYGSSIFRTDVSNSLVAEDRIGLKGILDNEHIKVIRAHKALGMKPETLVDIVILKNREEQVYGEQYYIDWNTLDIVIKKPNNDATYRVVLYFDYGVFNEILNNTEYHNYYDTDKLTPSVITPPEYKEPLREPIPDEEKTEPYPDPDAAEKDETSNEEEKVIVVVPPKQQTGDMIPSEKVVDLINNGATVAEIHNAMQQERTHAEDPKVALVPKKPEIIYSMEPTEQPTPPVGKKRFTSTAK